MRLRNWRALFAWAQRLSVRAARRASASALRRFTLAQSAAALALIALALALLLLRQLPLRTDTPATVSNAAAQFDAGAPLQQGGTDAPALEPVRPQ